MSHHKIMCRSCRQLVSQCRCPAENKIVMWVEQCAECLKKSASSHDVELPKPDQYTMSDLAHGISVLTIERDRSRALVSELVCAMTAWWSWEDAEVQGTAQQMSLYDRVREAYEAATDYLAKIDQ